MLGKSGFKEPVAWMYIYPGRVVVGVSEIFLSEVKIDRSLGTWLDKPVEEVPLYARPQTPRDPMKLAEMVRDACWEENSRFAWLDSSDLAAIVKKWENV